MNSEFVPAEGEPALHAPPGFLSWVAKLVHRHRGRLLSYAQKRGLCAEDSLDAVQDSFISFLKLPQARQIADRDEDALKLLYVILRHNLLNQKRKVSRRRRKAQQVELEALPLRSPSSETLIAQAEELARLRGCILRMAHLQRSVVTLSLLDDCSREEVAEFLGITPGYVRVLLHRARAHLRDCSDEDFVFREEEIRDSLFV